MPARETVDTTRFNPHAELPFELRLKDFEIAMQDVYDFFYDVNVLFDRKGLPRLDDELRPANMSGMGELGTRTATVDRKGLKKVRSNWVYKL